MRRSTTGEAVEALLSGTAIGPAKGTEESPVKNQDELNVAHTETAASIAAPAQKANVAKKEPVQPSSANTSAANVASLSEPISLPSRKKFEETHTRSTFYVENELLDILNTVAVEKGQKTFIVNEALRRFLAVIQQS